MENQQALNLQRHILLFAICILAVIFFFHFMAAVEKLERWRAAFNLVGFIFTIRTLKQSSYGG